MDVENIPVINEPVGVLVSGGTDSALLLYILLQRYQSTLQIFTIANSKKKYYNTKAALDVVEKCIQLTGNNNVEHHIFHRFVQNDLDFKNILQTYKQRKLVSKVYSGITANPPSDVLKDFPDEQSDRDKEIRNPLVLKDIMPINSDYILPWININKKEISRIYNNLNLDNDLFYVTRSCESEIDIGHGHCGKCWWCKERLWAFDKL